MREPRFQKPITSADELAALIGTPSEVALKKQLARLDDHMRTFIAESPFVLIGTVGRDGSCDVSPRGDAPGQLAALLDPTTLIIPERRGNRRADSLRNIIETGRAALLFLIPGVSESLRVNGRALVFQDEDVLAPLAVQGNRPIVGISLEVEECFLQCGKALIRSKLWEGRPTAPNATRPSFAQVLKDQTGIEGQTVESLQTQIEDSYKNLLY